MSTPAPATETEVPRRSPMRWWPAVVILALAAAFWLAIWQFQDVHRQTKNLQTSGLILVTLVLLWLWVLLLSRLRWTRRLFICGGAAGLAGILAATLEIRGVTGDLVPVLEWRWSKSTSQRLPVAQPTIEPRRVPLPIMAANDYPQISGPERSGKLTGPQLARDWEAQPPKLLWRQPIGASWSGFAVAGQYAVTMEQRGESELVACYHLLTGDLIWTHADKSHYESVIAGEGPRSIPTIVNGRVYTLGPSGILNCLNLADGATIWLKNILTENESSAPGWGVSCSPLVTDGKVIVSAGGDQGRSLVAYATETGDLIWSGGDDRAGYSSPVMATIDGIAQILIFNSPGVKSHDPNTGRVLWGYDWPKDHPHIVMPVVLADNRVLISSGYGTGSHLVQVRQNPPESWSATRIWESKRLKSKFANIIVRDGSIYGLDDGIFVCLDLASGTMQWKRGRYGHGQMIQVGDLLLLMAENGDLILLEPTPKELRELARFPVLSDKTWNPLALAGQYLLVRNDKEAACYQLPLSLPEGPP
jgi:outer membrane protein assembly factor BamB